MVITIAIIVIITVIIIIHYQIILKEVEDGALALVLKIL
jgi:hypothetical protein